ncbi:hypothetical protein FNV43_RR09829 [Rhamnella rubrinervis]|uniref:non-specific serine/threonine protein kinase n=1 Tax=Rhamnella rubrinervis TaxID=2594499 RepID=A0A8K0MKQ9_9ROSA|nr:hypothetical protein FNV43_RR09829 [Rhamnella rubrinervis]
MFSKLLITLSTLFLVTVIAADEDLIVTYNGFRTANLSLDGIAEFTPNGLLRLTNDTEQQKGHAFYPNPVTFKNSMINSTAFSFSTNFVFAIRSEFPTHSCHGISFVITLTRGLPESLPSYLGLFNETNNGNDTNHVIAVELDTIYSSEFDDINDNHVGIDINGLKSANSSVAGYYEDKNGEFTHLTLTSGRSMKVWIEYDGNEKQMKVTLAPSNIGKPHTPLLSLTRDLSSIVNNTMYVGFSSSTGSVPTSHYILGWSFKINGQAQELVLSQLPKLPRMGKKDRTPILTAGLAMTSVIITTLTISGILFLVRRKRKFAELVEDWEIDSNYGTQRGILPSNVEIAVKRVSHESRQGMREFVAEIVSMGRLRHRNLVQLMGYCRRKRELMLVYDYMSNGSLDKYLFDQPKINLNWSLRFRIIKGVASGLFYLHEGWEQVVVHRDVKASNVLLDSEFNARLGDFGLARLYDHGSDPQTTHVVGTIGYLSPKHLRTGKATTSADVFALGAFLLEVACGRRPIEARRPEDMILVDQVYSCWKEGDILVAKDPKLEPSARPSMRQVVKYLEGDIPLPNLTLLRQSSSGFTFAGPVGFDDVAMSYPYAIDKAFSYASSSVAESSVANDSKENIDAGSSTSLSSEAHVFAQASGKVY